MENRSRQTLDTQDTGVRGGSYKGSRLKEVPKLLEMVLFPSSPQEGEGIKVILDSGNIIPLGTRIVIIGKSASLVLSEHDRRPWAYCLGGLGRGVYEPV